MRNSSSANKSSLAWSAFICFLFEIIFQKSAFASSCIQHEPESIDSVAYSHHWMEARRQRDIVAGIIAVGKALRQKCNENKGLISFDSCKSLLKPARESLKVHSDSLEYHKRFDRLYADVRVPDTSCYKFDTTKPFSVTYARSGMGRVYNVMEISKDSIVTKIAEVDSFVNFAQRVHAPRYPVFRAKSGSSEIGLISKAIQESHILELMASYRNSDILDGVQETFIIKQMHWTKIVRLSNYSPYETKMLISALDSITMRASRISDDDIQELNKYNIMINGWDFFKPPVAPPEKHSESSASKLSQKRQIPCKD